MLSYRKERIENALLFFSQEHYKKTAEYLNVTRGQIDSLRYAGKLKYRMIGGAVRFEPADIRAFGQLT